MTPFYPVALAFVSVSLMGQPMAAAGGVSSQLRDLETKQALKELLAPTAADQANARALTNLASELAAALLVPRADMAAGSFDESIVNGQARFTVPLVFSSGSALASRVRSLGTALGAIAGAPNTVCFSGPGGVGERLKVSLAAEATLLQALSVSDIAPVPMLRAQMDGRVVVLSGARVGDALFGGFDELARAGQAEITLSLAPLPEWQPVRLSLTTTEGQRVTIPVELDGADRKLEIASETRWVLNGVDTGVFFDADHLGQIVLLAEVMRSGNLKLTQVARSDHYPVSESVLPETIDYSFHLLGARNAWFATVPHAIEPKMRVRHTSGECSLLVEFSSNNPPIADLGWLPLSIWNEVVDAKAVPPTALVAVVGYLSEPRCASDGGGLTAEEFDRIMTLPATCKALCNRVVRAAQSFVTKGPKGGKILER